jgi:radical SAM superfamily enzyme YgiQ (UPF0313 family)
MHKEKINIKWTCMTRANNVTEDLLQEMKNAGCWQIGIGVESGNQNVLNFIKKEINLEQIRNAIKWSHKIGIYVKGFFMIGHPIDTIETIDETISFAKSIPFTDVVVTIATPIPGTKFYSLAPNFGIFCDYDWTKFSYWKPVFVPWGLTKRILYRKQRQFYAEFYLRYKIILRQLRKMQNVMYFLKYVKNIAIIAKSLFSKERLT